MLYFLISSFICSALLTKKDKVSVLAWNKDIARIEGYQCQALEERLLRVMIPRKAQSCSDHESHISCPNHLGPK